MLWSRCVDRPIAGVRHYCRMRRIIVPLSLGLALFGASSAQATVHAPGLPAVGDHFYDLKGHSTLGPLPAKLRLGVVDAGGGRQAWSLDTSSPDGSGVVEELTVNRHADGVYLSRYHLHISNGVLGLDLNFIPSGGAALFMPDHVSAGRTWSFDLNSDDGCVLTHTVGSSPTGAPGARHVRLATTAKSSDKAGCTQLKATRTQDLWVPVDSSLPTRIDGNLSGTVNGVGSAGVTYKANLRKS